MPTLAYKFKEFEIEKARARQGARNDLKQDDISAPVRLGCEDETLNNEVKGKTLEIIAQKAGVSRATAEQYDAIQRKGTEEQNLRSDSSKSRNWL